MALFQVSNRELSFLAHRGAKESSTLVEDRFISNIFFHRFSHTEHKRISVRLRANIYSSRVGEALDPRVVSIRDEFENVAFENA